MLGVFPEHWPFCPCQTAPIGEMEPEDRRSDGQEMESRGRARPSPRQIRCQAGRRHDAVETRRRGPGVVESLETGSEEPASMVFWKIDRAMSLVSCGGRDVTILHLPVNGQTQRPGILK